MTMRIFTETPMRLSSPRMAIGSTVDMLKAQRREVDSDVARVRARMERDILSPMWRRLYEDFATKEARTEAMRPAMGKPLSRRARRRNRGRVRAAKGVLMRRFSPSVQWAWPDQPPGHLSLG